MDLESIIEPIIEIFIIEEIKNMKFKKDEIYPQRDIKSVYNEHMYKMWVGEHYMLCYQKQKGFNRILKVIEKYRLFEKVKQYHYKCMFETNYNFDSDDGFNF